MTTTLGLVTISKSRLDQNVAGFSCRYTTRLLAEIGSVVMTSVYSPGSQPAISVRASNTTPAVPALLAQISTNFRLHS
jgi:hypothetical protein